MLSPTLEAVHDPKKQTRNREVLRPFWGDATLLCDDLPEGLSEAFNMWVVVKIQVPFWVLYIIRHLMFRVPKKGP